MSNEVFANSNEIACKSGDDKVIAAFPDVCLSPPSPPAGPVPIPYPDTSFSKDMKNGSKTVKINGKEVMLKDKSFYKTSPLGDEAATKGLGAGVISHVITGKTYFVAWSMDVKFEGQNVDRHLDLTTSNHASPMANEAVPHPGLEGVAPGTQGRLFCECCNGPVHSVAQAFGNEITEEEFYKPSQTGPTATRRRGHSNLSRREERNADESSFVYDYIRETGECEELLPPDPPGDDPCNKYYRNTAGENKRARDDFNDLKNINHEKFRPELAGADIAHRVPIAAGGCPVGVGNHQVVSEKCKDTEKYLGEIQGNMATIIR